jgi:hypothetical protein
VILRAMCRRSEQVKVGVGVLVLHPHTFESVTRCSSGTEVS